MKYAWVLILFLINTQAFGQKTLADITKIDGERISAQTAKKHLTQKKFYYLVVGEFAKFPFIDCEQKAWDKLGFKVKHVSNYGFPEINEYNQVVFTYLDSIFGNNWKTEKDSFIENCQRNYQCNINAFEWEYDDGYPLIIFEEKSDILNAKGKCLIDEVYFQILTHPRVTEIRLTGGQAKNEKNNGLYLRRCESVKNYLIEKGIKKELIKIDQNIWSRDFCRNQPNCSEEFRKWNRAVIFNYKFN